MRRNRIIIVAAVVIIVLLLPVSYSRQIRGAIVSSSQPLLEFLYEQSLSIRKIAITIRDLRRLPTENENLVAQVSRLLAENSTLNELKHENQLLRQELKIPVGEQRNKIIASRVIARSTLSFLDLVTIDHGHVDGVTIGQAVTVNNAFVGKVVSVGPRTADIQLVTSSDAITQGQLQTSRASGVVRGGIRGLVLEYIPQDTVITSGEVVITSGLGGVLRPGILIGTVEAVISKKNDIFQSISIKPAVSISKVDIVFVEVPL